MIKNLIKLSNHLDLLGLSKESNVVDSYIKKIGGEANSSYGKFYVYDNKANKKVLLSLGEQKDFIQITVIDNKITFETKKWLPLNNVHSYSSEVNSIYVVNFLGLVGYCRSGVNNLMHYISNNGDVSVFKFEKEQKNNTVLKKSLLDFIIEEKDGSGVEKISNEQYKKYYDSLKIKNNNETKSLIEIPQIESNLFNKKVEDDDYIYLINNIGTSVSFTNKKTKKTGVIDSKYSGWSQVVSNLNKYKPQ